MKTKKNRHNYNLFLTKIKQVGYSMIQKSVYVRFIDGTYSINQECKWLHNFASSSISILIYYG